MTLRESLEVLQMSLLKNALNSAIFARCKRFSSIYAAVILRHNNSVLQRTYRSLHKWLRIKLLEKIGDIFH